MKEEVSLQLSKENIAFAKRKANKEGKSISEIVDNYVKTFRKIEEGAKEAMKDPYVKAVRGMVNTGKNERVR